MRHGERERGTRVMVRTTGGVLTERAVGICPACGEAVYNSAELDGPVWTCRTDLSPHKAWWLPSEGTERDMARDGVWSDCPNDHAGKVFGAGSPLLLAPPDPDAGIERAEPAPRGGPVV